MKGTEKSALSRWYTLAISKLQAKAGNRKKNCQFSGSLEDNLGKEAKRANVIQRFYSPKRKRQKACWREKLKACTSPLHNIIPGENWTLSLGFSGPHSAR